MEKIEMSPKVHGPIPEPRNEPGKARKKQACSAPLHPPKHPSQLERSGKNLTPIVKFTFFIV